MEFSKVSKLLALQANKSELFSDAAKPISFWKIKHYYCDCCLLLMQEYKHQSLYAM